MRRFLEKSFILILCLYNSHRINYIVDIVPLFLLCLMVSLLLDLCSNPKYRYIIYISFVSMCIYNEEFLIYLPLILYNGYLDFKLYIIIISPLLFLNFSISNLVLSIITIYISATTDEYNRLLDTNKTIRDSLIEDALYLKKYSEQLNIDREKNIHIAILTERNRIARELHDSIGHSLSSGILQIEALKITSEEEKIIESLDILQDTLKNGMEDIRKSIHNLYNESLDLEGKIYELGQDIPELDLELNYHVLENLGYELKFDILSICKEAITNCAKHSNGDKLKISLIEQPKFYSLSLKDNGSNFDPRENISNKGIGLSSMREIAHKYNGFMNHSFDRGFNIHIILMKGQ